jgi:tRNA1Val (adenine37-N6)-methyltransferase
LAQESLETRIFDILIVLTLFVFINKISNFAKSKEIIFYFKYLIKSILHPVHAPMADKKQSFFCFRQFKVSQDRSAMKVSTDACIFGAWLPVEDAQKILDIGSGTALLCLMTAQRSKAHITGIEVEKSAFEQSLENVAQSPWADRIRLIHQSIQDYAQNSGNEKYDWICSNPPFFEASYLSPDPHRSLARHTESLSQEDLLRAVDTLLSDSGHFALILPCTEGERLILKALKYNLYLTKKVLIRNFPHREAHRQIMLFGRTEKSIELSNLLIRHDPQNYTDEFKNLLRAYYLNVDAL